MLRKTLFSTNPIESALSVVEEKCHRVKPMADRRHETALGFVRPARGRIPVSKGERSQRPSTTDRGYSDLSQERSSKRCCSQPKGGVAWIVSRVATSNGESGNVSWAPRDGCSASIFRRASSLQQGPPSASMLLGTGNVSSCRTPPVCVHPRSSLFRTGLRCFPSDRIGGTR
jgi:hypothetical protein